MQITSAAFTCSLGINTAVLVVGKGGKRSNVVVRGNCFGEEGVWLQVSSAPDFWLDVYVPTFTAREIHLRSQEKGVSVLKK